MRFIAINSGVDSANQQDNEFVPFVNIINEYYVRDGSKKVRTSLRIKGESGEHLTTIPPYGYVKDPIIQSIGSSIRKRHRWSSASFPSAWTGTVRRRLLGC